MSAAPSKYTPNTSFKAFSQSNPTAQQPGDKLDAEFNEIRTVTDAVIDRLAIIQRDDGNLANASVGREALKPEVVSGINAPTTWAPFTLYSVRDSVIHLSKWQWALEDHTSGATFDPSKWQVIADFTEIGGSVVGVSPSMQGQLVRWGNGVGTQVVDAGPIETADIADDAVTGAKIAAAAIATAHIVDGAVTAAKLAAAALDLLLQKADNLSGLADAAAARTNLGLGTAATKDAGTAAGNVVALDGTGKLPAVNGSLLTGLPAPVTQAQMEAATDNAAFVTALQTKNHPGVAKAWALFTVSAGVLTVQASYGIASISRSSPGRYVVTFSTAFASATYALVGSASNTSGGAGRSVMYDDTAGKSSGTCGVIVCDNTGNVDALNNAVAFYGHQ